MRKTTIFATAFFLLLVTRASTQEKPPVSEFQFAANQSVYVIAVKSPAPIDRSTWEKLNRNLPKRNQSSSFPSNNDSSGRATLQRTQPERQTLERNEPTRRVLPPPEPQLKKMIEEEFLKQKKFKLAESPETADLILFAHGEYIYSFAATADRGRGTVIIATSGGGDGNTADLNTLARLSVAAIAASDYRQWQSDVAHLFEKAKWQEEVWGEFRREGNKPFDEPSAQKLVQQFHKQALKK